MIPTFNFCWGLKHLALYTVRAFSYSQQLGLVKQPDKGSDLHNIDHKTGKEKRKLLKVDLMGGIPKEHWPQVMNWSASNLELLFKVGYEAGLKFCDENAELLDLPQAKAKQAAPAEAAV